MFECKSGDDQGLDYLGKTRADLIIEANHLLDQVVLWCDAIKKSTEGF